MKCGEKIERLLTMLVILNLIIMGIIISIVSLRKIEIMFIMLQTLLFIAFYSYTHFVSTHKRHAVNAQSNDKPSGLELNLKSHEKCHEQKRHYQVALALIELGEKEKAISYIDSIMKEMA